MQGAIRHTSPLHATEELIRATFSDEAYTTLVGADGNRPDSVVILQKQFKTLVQFVRQQFDALKRGLENWREQVNLGEVDFSLSREECFKGELRAFNSIADLLGETFNRFHHQRGIFLSKPLPVNILLERKKEAQKILDSWRSPEWEVTNMRTVKWDKEQTKHLRARLASCE